MLISLQSTMEFISTTKGKPALIFDGRQFTLNRRIENGVWYGKGRVCGAGVMLQVAAEVRA